MSLGPNASRPDLHPVGAGAASCSANALLDPLDEGAKLLGLLCSLESLAFFASPKAAQAHSTSVPCSDETHTAVGGNENNNLRHGNQADILVYNFSGSQHYTWRMVWIRLNNMFNAEAGWSLDSQYDQNAHPYKTWHQNGVLQSKTLTSVNLTKGIFYTIKVHDQNNDHYWSFAYGGTGMGNEFVNMDYGTPIDESERHCGSDSLYSDHKNLSNIGCINCGWQPYSSLQQYVDSATDWAYCPVSTTEFQVKQSC